MPGDALYCPNDGTPLRPSHSGSDQAAEPDGYIGMEIAGHIEIKQLVGIGAMGRVYRAFQSGIERDVAVKILHKELSNNQQLVARFTREAKVASKLQHPNVVQVLLNGQLPDGALYIVMEYLDGMSLQSAMLGGGGALPLPRTLHLALQLCDAVGEAHVQGIVHRDLKPENVMLVRRGESRDFVKVLDFGIARLNWGEQSMATAAGLIFGTARYISPEGAQGKAVTPQGDVYSIATIIYQMLAGRTPFEGEQAVALLVQQIHDAPTHLRAHGRASYVPDPIADAVMKNLAKDPEARDPDARTFGRTLLEASRLVGLSLEEISSPLLLGRPSQPVSLPAMQRTRQLELSPELAERLTASPVSPQVAELARQTPTGAGPSAATVKWTPPLDVQEQMAQGMVARASSVTPSPPVSGSGHAPPRTEVPEARAPVPTPPPSGVDTTMDDATPPPTPPPRGSSPDAGRVVTEYGSPVPPAREPSRPSYPSRPSRPPEVDTTLGDAEPASRGRFRTAALVALCFLLGVLVAAVAAYKMGRAGPDAGREELVSRTQDALGRRHFVEPPGDNVRDLSAEGLRRWPGDSRLVQARARAAEELVGQASAAKGDEALRLARLARDLDPANAQAKKLVSELEEGSPTPPTSSSAPPTVPPLRGTTTAPTGAGTVAPPAGPAKVTLDVTNPKPRVGQPIELVAKVTSPSKAKATEAEFTITGPGLAGVRLPANEDGGLFRAGYTFFEAGKFDVVFTAKVDGASVRTSRVVTPGDGATVTPPPPASTTAPPPPSSSVKWL
jgi:serine/threonine-protein kinase